MGLALFNSSQSQVVFSILRVFGFFSSASSSTLMSSSSSGLASTGSLSSSIGSSISSVFIVYLKRNGYIKTEANKYSLISITDNLK